MVRDRSPALHRRLVDRQLVSALLDLGQRGAQDLDNLDR
jgi:hypothetical protein